MPSIKAISSRRVLNSHIQFTNEFIIELDNGAIGIGTSPKGETISIYEDRNNLITPHTVTEILEKACLGRDMDQYDFDTVLEQRLAELGRDNTCALSIAFFNALAVSRSVFDLWDKASEDLRIPCLCCNILNGGWHAYTNPVLSDFSEYLLVARSNQLDEVIPAHNEIQRVVRERIQRLPVLLIGGNPVRHFSTTDNRECIEFLLGIRDELGLTDLFELMIDASAGDLWKEGKYELALTNKSLYAPMEFGEYWLGLIKEYNLNFLEDPFREQDTAAWKQLTASAGECRVIGDNFYSSNAGRIKRGAAERYTHGVIIKPNQAGTVSSVRCAVEAAQEAGQTVITSHRSISTEETFLSILTSVYQVKYIKIGPLFTDYSSVVRLNAILRLVEQASYAPTNQH